MAAAPDEWFIAAANEVYSIAVGESKCRAATGGAFMLMYSACILALRPSSSHLARPRGATENRLLFWTLNPTPEKACGHALWCIKTRGSRVSSRRCERGDRLSKGLAHPTRSHAACTSFGKLASMGAPARLSRVIMTHTFFPHQHCPRRAVDVPIGQANNQLFSACFWWQTLARPRSAAPAQSKTVGTKIRQVRTRSDSRQCIFSRSPAGITPGAQAQVCPPTSKSQTELLCLFRPTSCDGN